MTSLTGCLDKYIICQLQEFVNFPSIFLLLLSNRSKCQFSLLPRRFVSISHGFVTASFSTTLLKIVKNSLNRRFGIRIFFKRLHHRFCNFIGSFSLFICSPLQLYLKHFAIVSCPVLSLCCYIFRPVLSQSFSHLLPLFLCVLPRRRNPKPGYRNMSANTSVLVIRNDPAIFWVLLCQSADCRFIRPL